MDDDSVTLTRAELERLQSRMLQSRGRSAEWTQGVRSAFSALWQQIPAGGDLQYPVLGMTVKCKTRPCVLNVIQIKRAQKHKGSWSSLIQVQVFPEYEGTHFRHKKAEPHNLWLWRSTWLRWVKGGKVLSKGRWENDP